MNRYLKHRRLLPAVAALGLCMALAGCGDGGDGGGGGGDGGGGGTVAASIVTGKNIAKLKANESLSIPVRVINTATPTAFTATTSGTCASITHTDAAIEVTAGATAPCRQDVIITAGTLTKTITLNVYDPMVMDLGEGLLLRFVNRFHPIGSDTFWVGARWTLVERAVRPTVFFWHPDTSELNAGAAAEDRWLPISSYVRPDYTNVSQTQDVPVIVLKDTSPDKKHLRAPKSYELVWQDPFPDPLQPLFAIYRPVCPDERPGGPDERPGGQLYVPLGFLAFSPFIVQTGDGVWCVAERFTTKGLPPLDFLNEQNVNEFAEAFIFGFEDASAPPCKGAAPCGFAMFKAGPPILTPPAGYAALFDTQAAVACKAAFYGGTTVAEECEGDEFNLLLIPIEKAEESDDGGEKIKLTGPSPLGATSARFNTNIRVPFTMIPSENPFCDVPGLEDGAECRIKKLRVQHNVTNSPFYYIAREERYVPLAGLTFDNTDGGTPQPMGPLTLTTGFSQTDSEAFTNQTGTTISYELSGGIEIGSEKKGATASFGGKWSKDVSEQFSWSKERSLSFASEVQIAYGPYTCPEKSFCQVVNVVTAFFGMDEAGQSLGNGVRSSGGQDTARFLLYPIP